MIERLIVKEIISLEDLHSMVTPSEWTHSESFRSQSRRQEWLSWRAVLRRSLQEEPFGGVSSSFEIAYGECGAPYIVGTPIYISVSHTRTHVAVLLCDRACAVDMELLDRNFSRVATRYLSPLEQKRIDPITMPIAWCAKEVAYKFCTDQPLDFVRDATIESVDHTNQNLVIHIKGTRHVAKFIVENSYCIVWLCDNPALQ